MTPGSFHYYDYKTVSTITQWGMARTAKKLMRDGWQPLGGISCSFGIFYQAFTK